LLVAGEEWPLQAIVDLVEQVYRVTACFPDGERFGLTNQLRRAAVSVPSNIAEGQGRRLRKQFALFLRIARGSVQEVETQLLIALRLNFAAKDQIDPVLNTCGSAGRLIAGLLRSIEVG
jgi:four helix bundle protein